MFTEAVSRKTLQALELVGRSRVLPPRTYLAGGTAATLHLGHRYSYDLDFFTPRKFDPKRVSKKFKQLPDFRLQEVAWQTVLGYIGKIQCTLFFYQYPLLFPSYEFRGVTIADLRDIAAMKIAAISERGKKRDFVDLYFLARTGGIDTLTAIQLFKQRFQMDDANRTHVLKSLAYFEDAEKDRMPRMIKPVSWPVVKRFFISEQKRIAKELLRLP